MRNNITGRQTEGIGAGTGAHVNPGNDGFADIAFIPKPGSKLPPMVVELKWGKPAQAALDQIREKNYPAALAGLSGECALVGVTYDPETCEHSCATERVVLG